MELAKLRTKISSSWYYIAQERVNIGTFFYWQAMKILGGNHALSNEFANAIILGDAYQIALAMANFSGFMSALRRVATIKSLFYYFASEQQFSLSSRAE